MKRNKRLAKKRRRKRSSNRSPRADITLPSSGTSHQQANVVRRTERHEFFSGPLPPPRVFEAYNNVQPDAADRILRMAESHQVHSQEMDVVITHSDVKKSETGQWIAFSFVSLTSMCGFVLLLLGKNVQGYTFGGVPLSGLIISYLLRFIRQSISSVRRNRSGREE
jgi:uncharacterized membrane protein